MDRKLQSILLLRDGRFASVGTSDFQSTIDSQPNLQACHCIVANSLLDLVARGQDSASRRILRTSLPELNTKQCRRVSDCSIARKAGFSASLRSVRAPRVADRSQKESLLGRFVLAEWAAGCLAACSRIMNTWLIRCGGKMSMPVRDPSLDIL
ncbi:unnamed protein product [Polarella glacialis]|uniref:Uncharacterized protein n=1 Tax=Polarella glacialis TaxID=89957 RepID=A0A813FTK2_POLGL|nr:unnamed protein product [Polarella glacialis]